MDTTVMIANKKKKISNTEKQVLRLLDPYYLLLFVGFFYNTIIFYVTWVMNKVPYGDIVSPFVTPVLVGIGVVMYCTQNPVGSVINRPGVLFVLGVLATVSISMLVHPQTQEVVMERYVGRVLVTCIPYFALGLLLRLDDATFEFLGFWSKIAVVVGMAYLYYLLNFGNPDALVDDNMGLAYNYLYVVSLVVLDVFRKFSVSGLICSIVGVVMVISLGTRGPAILLLVFLFCCFLYKSFYRRPLRVIAVSSVAVVLMAVMGFFEAILLWLIELVENMGLSTRVLEQLLEESVFESEERGSILVLLGEKIMESPYIGYGVAGEWQFVNWNAHNMYYTFWSNFGLIFGTAGIVALIYVSVRAFWITYHDKKALLMVTMLICWVFPKGFFAGEPLTMEVFLLLGVALHVLREHKEKQRGLPRDQRRKR